MINNSAIYNVMLYAVQQASKPLKRDFGEIEYLQSSIKGSTNFVEKAEERTKKILLSELSKARPEFGFITSKIDNFQKLPSNSFWIIEPINGKKNFSHGLPYFAISIALFENNSIVAGLTYNPANDDIFYAEKGSGAIYNNRRIRVSSRKNIQECLISSNLDNRKLEINSLDRKYISFLEENTHIRKIGSTCLDLAYVASGRFDGYVNSNFHISEFSAGIILIKEAGGYVTNTHGDNPIKEISGLIAGNPSTHEIMLKGLISTL